MLRRICFHRSSWGFQRASRNSFNATLLSPPVPPPIPPMPSTITGLAFPRFLGGLKENQGSTSIASSFARLSSSKASHEPGQSTDKTKKDITNVEDPFSAPTYNIPEKPVTFVEGASYSVIILAGLGVAAAAGYAVFKELIFQPKE